MGGSQSRAGQDAYARLESHRDALYQRQLEHRQRCEQTKQRAREQLRLGNRVGAVNLARQLKTLENQERTIAGIVTNLDAQKATLETKQITNETMNVMAACVKTLGKGSLTVSAVEDAMELNDDAAAELREVAEALSIPFDASDSDDFLLSELQEALGEADDAKVGSGTGPVVGMDDAFLTWMRLTAGAPDAPEHLPAPSAPAGQLGNTDVAAPPPPANVSVHLL